MKGRIGFKIKRALSLLALRAAITFIVADFSLPAVAQKTISSKNLLPVGDTVVKRIYPKPISDSTYLASDYTEIHFKLNSAELDISYMNNGLSMLHLDRVVDSIGIDNISAIEIISQSSPEGTLERNTWLTNHRSEEMKNYMNRVFPELKDRLSLNKVTESWENLAQYVAQDPVMEDETKNRILDIIDSDKLSVADKKYKLKRSLGTDPKIGNVYDYLIKYYYPSIRNSGIYILHMVEPEPEFTKDPEKPFAEEPSPTLTDSIAFTPQTPVPEEVFRKRPFIAVKTNLAYDAFFTKDMGWAPIYNIEAELYPTETGRWSWLLEYEFPWHSMPNSHQYLQILNLQFEARRYFKKASYHSGHYLSAYVGANLYDICMDSKAGHGYQGEGYGMGLGYGYVLPLGKRPDTRWKLEIFAKGGFYMTFYDPYDAGSPFAGKYYYEWYDAPSLFIRRNMVFRWLGPTGGGITLSYDLIRKKVKINKPFQPLE